MFQTRGSVGIVDKTFSRQGKQEVRRQPDGKKRSGNGMKPAVASLTMSGDALGALLVASLTPAPLAAAIACFASHCRSASPVLRTCLGNWFSTAKARCPTLESWNASENES
jgi:hypothetical protein